MGMRSWTCSEGRHAGVTKSEGPSGGSGVVQLVDDSSWCSSGEGVYLDRCRRDRWLQLAGRAGRRGFFWGGGEGGARKGSAVRESGRVAA